MYSICPSFICTWNSSPAPGTRTACAGACARMSPPPLRMMMVRPVRLSFWARSKSSAICQSQPTTSVSTATAATTAGQMRRYSLWPRKPRVTVRPSRAAGARGGRRSRRRAAPRRDQPPRGAATRAAVERGGFFSCLLLREHVAHATHREDAFGVFAVIFDGVADASHVHVDRAAEGLQFAPARGPHDLVAREHAAGALGHGHQQVELVGGEFAGPAAHLHGAGIAVDLQRTETQHGRDALGRDGTFA